MFLRATDQLIGNARRIGDSRRIAHIVLLLGAGVVAAAQIGKAIICIPLIRAELDASLSLSGLIVGAFATLGASFGIGAGFVAQRLGLRRALIGGMALIAAANLAGAAAPTAATLLAARLAEGVGFVAVAVSAPSLLAVVVRPAQRDFVMALWGAYMPTGIGLSLVLGPLAATLGWRGFWLANAGLVAVAAALLAVAAPPAPRRTETGRVGASGDLAALFGNARCMTLAITFFAYSCQIFAMTFALPQLLTSAGVGVGVAGLMSAAVLAVSVSGHVCSGFALRAGSPIWANVAAAFAAYAVAAIFVYSNLATPAERLAAAAVALGIGGLAPGAFYAAAPRVAGGRHALPLAIGLFQQASNLGQFAGPYVMGVWAQRFGWDEAPSIVTPAALVGIALALFLRLLLVETPAARSEQAARSCRE